MALVFTTESTAPSFFRESCRDMARRRGGGKRIQRRSHANLHAGISTLDEDEALSFVEKLDEVPFLLILDQVQDPRNLGACLRSASGAGVNLVVIPADRSVGLTEVVRHVAAGAAETLPIARVRNLSRFLRALSDLGIRLVGTSDRADTTLYDLDLTGSLGLVMGAEGTGIRRLTADCCDDLTVIPMQGQVDCLNVSVAAGVCLFEAARQRLG